MPRKLRIQYPGAMYHIMSRGDRGERIFLNDVDRHDFIKTLAEACQKTDWQVHAYCLMSNHFHLVIETPQANLVEGMKWLRKVMTDHDFIKAFSPPSQNPAKSSSNRPHKRAFLAPQSQQGSLVGPHDHPGIGTANEAPATRTFGGNLCSFEREGHDALQFSYSRISSAALRMTPSASADESRNKLSR